MQATTWRDFEGKTVDGKYHLQRLVGTGSFGAVFVADEVVADRLIRQVAVKLIDPEAVHREEQFAELIAAANLDHPALLRCIAPGQTEIEGRLLLTLVTELAQESLADRLENGPLSLVATQGLAEQIGGALAYLHARPRPLIHRDVKPGNILRVGETWKLGDFGLLQAMPEAGGAAQASRVGTPAYAPPESYDGVLSPAWDVWSFGALLYECLVGRLPFTATTPQQFHIAVVSQEPNWPDSLPTPFDAILPGCLRRDPGQRWTIQQVLEALRTSAPSAFPASPDLAAGFYARLDAVTPIPTPSATAEVVVALDHSGDYRSIGEAIRSAAVGTRIRVRPGVYHETLLLDREVEIVADGAPGCVVVETKGAACLVVRSGQSIVRGLALHSRAGLGGRRHHAVEIIGGEPLLEDCDLLCGSQAIVSVQGPNARPCLRRCRLHDGKTGGIVFADQAAGTLEACEIDSNAGPGILLRTAADPSVRDCRVHTGREAGVVVAEGGRGLFEDCDIHSNLGPNLQLSDNAAPIFRRCRIRDGQQAGIAARNGAQGLFEDCEIYANGLTGVTLTQQANPVFLRCTLRDGHANGLTVSDGGQGLLENCSISGNAFAGIKVAKGGSPVLLRTSLFGGKRSGILVQAQGRATLTECDLHTNQQANAQVENHGVLLLRQCLLHDSAEAGALFAGEGRLEGCEIYANAGAGLEVPTGGSVVLRNCRVHHGLFPGLLVQGGEALMEDCDLFSNAMSNAAVGDRGRLDMRRCNLRDSRQYGLLFWGGATGQADDCEISGNALGGVRLNACGHPLLQRCRLVRNGGFGLHASDKAEATFAHCDLRENLSGPAHIEKPSRIVNTECLV
jgi:F-box protein 11